MPTTSIRLCGLTDLEAWLKDFPDAAMAAGIDPIDCPLSVSPNDLSDVIRALQENKDQFLNVEMPPSPRVTFDEKNSLNSMSADYAREQRRRYLKYTPMIAAFLAAPENKHLQGMYETIIEEFQLNILAKRKSYQSFDEVMEYLIEIERRSAKSSLLLGYLV